MYTTLRISNLSSIVRSTLSIVAVWLCTHNQGQNHDHQPLHWSDSVGVPLCSRSPLKQLNSSHNSLYSSTSSCLSEIDVFWCYNMHVLNWPQILWIKGIKHTTLLHPHQGNDTIQSVICPDDSTRIVAKKTLAKINLWLVYWNILATQESTMLAYYVDNWTEV